MCVCVCGGGDGNYTEHYAVATRDLHCRLKRKERKKRKKRKKKVKGQLTEFRVSVTCMTAVNLSAS